MRGTGKVIQYQVGQTYQIPKQGVRKALHCASVAGLQRDLALEAISQAWPDDLQRVSASHTLATFLMSGSLSQTCLFNRLVFGVLWKPLMTEAEYLLLHSINLACSADLFIAVDDHWMLE